MLETLSFAEADARFQLSSMLDAYDEGEDVILLPPGTHGASALDLDEASYVVDGDLVIDGDIAASEEGGFLVVRGNLRVGNLLIGGPMVHVLGSLWADHAIATDYNHGTLRVDGDVRAAIIAAEHLFEIRGALDCASTIDFGGFRVAAPSFQPTLTRQQAARESKDYLVAAVLNEGGYVDGAKLAEFLADGGNPILARA